jgi:hypothetical protein
VEQIKETIKNVLGALEARQKPDPQEKLKVLLKRLLTKKEARHIQFHYFKKGVLHIKVDSSTWLYHVNLRKEGLLAKIRKGFNAVKDIRFRIGEVK